MGHNLPDPKAPRRWTVGQTDGLPRVQQFMGVPAGGGLPEPIWEKLCALLAFPVGRDFIPGGDVWGAATKSAKPFPRPQCA